jgi:hypothetical protein
MQAIFGNDKRCWALSTDGLTHPAIFFSYSLRMGEQCVYQGRGIGTGVKHGGKPLSCDSADGNKRKTAYSTSHLFQASQSDNCLVIRFRSGLKDRPDSYVIDRLADPLSSLLEAMRRQPYHRICAKNVASGVGRYVILSQMHAPDPRHQSNVDTIVYQHAYPNFGRHRGRKSGLGIKVTTRAGFISKLNDRRATRGKSPQLFMVRQPGKTCISDGIDPGKFEGQLSGFIIKKQSSPSL